MKRTTFTPDGISGLVGSFELPSIATIEGETFRILTQRGSGAEILNIVGVNTRGESVPLALEEGHLVINKAEDAEYFAEIIEP